MRKLGIILLVLLALAVIADFGLKLLAQRAVSAELASSLELDARPDVSISAWPFVARFLSGELQGIDVHAEDVDTDALDLQRIDLAIDDLTFEPGEVISGNPDDIRTSGGSGSAAFTDDALTRALRDAGAPLRMIFDSGEVTVRSDAGEATGQVTLDGDRLIVSAGGDLSSAVELPSLGGRVGYESLRIADGRVTLELSLEGGPLNP